MTEKNALDFSDLEDNIWSGDATVEPVVEVTIFTEACPHCRGTGTWRPGYKCFKCKGTGQLEFKTSAKQRASGRKSAAKSAVKKAAASADAFLVVLNTMPDVRDWIIPACVEGNSWAQSMYAGGEKYGQLTENMVIAIRNQIAKDDDAAGGASEWIKNNEAEHAWLVAETAVGNEFASSLLNGQYGLMKRGSLSENQVAAVRKNLDKAKDFPVSDLDISGLKGYFAVPDGDTRLKLCIRHKGKQSRLNGWIFVDDGAAYGSRQTYGKQAPEAGSKYVGQVQDALREILKNPLEAQVAYGKLTGTCGHCGKILEDPKSVAAGIGPICAAKYG